MDLKWCKGAIGLVAREGVGTNAKLDGGGYVTNTRCVGKYHLSAEFTVKVGDLDVSGRGDGFVGV